jgi:SSS family solute:Na+ symporter
MNTAITISPLDTGVIIVYFIAIIAAGTAMGGFTRSTKDFFLAGQRFSAWLIAFSCIATTVGSYSFIKYATAGFNYGISSSMSYLNDWLWFGFYAFGWLPIIYYSGVISVPEYFERRFNARCRAVASAVLLLYMVGYIGINLYTLGVALEPILLPHIQTVWPWFSTFDLVVVIAAFTSIYVVAGGQTSVILTDLIQGVLLLFLGLTLFGLGIRYMHAHDAAFWANLPPLWRVPVYKLHEPGNFNSLGIFWQDGVANSAAFWFMNQGLILRMLSARTARDARKAFTITLFILMPLGTICVSSAGWIGRSMVGAGLLPEGVDPKHIFITVANEVVHTPGFFGLILAALTAALMSTADTLINAVASVSVNDIYRRFWVKDKPDRHYLSMARWISILAAIIGVAIVPVYMKFKSIYVAHGAFTAAITPPLVVPIFLAAFWRKYTAKAAMATMIGGVVLIGISIWRPEIMEWCRLGIGDGGDKYFRALFGIVVCTAIGVIVSYLTAHDASESTEGLVWGPERKFMELYKGGPVNERDGEKVRLNVLVADLPDEQVVVPPDAADRLSAEIGDILFLSDPGRWHGGLKSAHVRLGALPEGVEAPQEGEVLVNADLFEQARLKKGGSAILWKIM